MTGLSGSSRSTKCLISTDYRSQKSLGMNRAMGSDKAGNHPATTKTRTRKNKNMSTAETSEEKKQEIRNGANATALGEVPEEVHNDLKSANLHSIQVMGKNTWSSPLRWCGAGLLFPVIAAVTLPIHGLEWERSAGKRMIEEPGDRFFRVVDDGAARFELTRGERKPPRISSKEAMAPAMDQWNEKKMEP